jgi:hypothetical protein
MKIDTLHPDRTAERWKKCRDCSEGQDAVHKAGKAYLPELSGQSVKEYNAYKARTPFFNATARTIDGLVGMVFRKYPKTVVPAAMDEMVADIDLEGESIDLKSKEVLREVIEVGRIGLLVEYPRTIEGPPTLAQAAALNYRPYVVEYKAEQILNWREMRVNNKMQPVFISLYETEEVWDGYEQSSVEQIRILELLEGAYTQSIWRKGNNTKEWVIVDQVTPTRNGTPLDYIPFICFNPNQLGFEVEKPPILDLVEINLSHYRTSADYENGAHFCGVPTPVLAGFQFDEKDVVKIGFGAIVSTDPTAKASFLEFTGQGLQPLKESLKDKEAQMAALGSRMLASEKKQAEAQDTVRLRHAGEGAVLAAMAKTVSEGMTRILEIMRDWQGISGDVDHELNSDFVDAGLSAQELTALVSSWQMGAMSYESLHWNLKRGEMLPETSEVEDEQAKIANAAPVMSQHEPVR